MVQQGAPSSNYLCNESQWHYGGDVINTKKDFELMNKKSTVNKRATFPRHHQMALRKQPIQERWHNVLNLCKFWMAEMRFMSVQNLNILQMYTNLKQLWTSSYRGLLFSIMYVTEAFEVHS